MRPCNVQRLRPGRPAGHVAPWWAALLGALVLMLACGAGVARAADYTNPVIAGDHPDPTAVKAGGAFYASATTSAWVPAFPVFRSTDLVGWQEVGAVLPVVPAWVSGRLWAPELVHEPEEFRAYWGAARRGGTPCIALSTASRAAGPWRYRGRVTCPAGGAIDAQPFRDTDGSRWLIYKEGASGRGSAAIVAQRLDARGLRAVGAPRVLLRADAPWEGSVVEGPSLIRLNGQDTLFYSGGHCCSLPCSYAEGVARAPALLGPYVKSPDNPILRSDASWTCPGHGTVIRTGTGLAFLHHAFAAADLGQRRRPILLDAVGVGVDGWPTIGTAGGSVATAPQPIGTTPQPKPAPGFSDGFPGGLLQPGWEWLFDAVPAQAVSGGALTVSCGGPLVFVARQVAADAFVATADVAAPRGDAAAGLAVNLGRGVRGVEIRHGRVRAFVAGPARTATGPSVALPDSRGARLVVTVNGAGVVGTYLRAAGGTLLPIPAGPAATGAGPTRVALTCRGRGTAAFGSASARTS